MPGASGMPGGASGAFQADAAYMQHLGMQSQWSNDPAQPASLPLAMASFMRQNSTSSGNSPAPMGPTAPAPAQNPLGLGQNSMPPNMNSLPFGQSSMGPGQMTAQNSLSNMGLSQMGLAGGAGGLCGGAAQMGNPSLFDRRQSSRPPSVHSSHSIPSGNHLLGASRTSHSLERELCF